MKLQSEASDSGNNEVRQSRQSRSKLCKDLVLLSLKKFNNNFNNRCEVEIKGLRVMYSIGFFKKAEDYVEQCYKVLQTLNEMSTN